MDEDFEIAQQVARMVSAANPNFRVTAEIHDSMCSVVRMRYACPCGEQSSQQVVINGYEPPEMVARQMVDRMRHHVISEGNTPDF